MITNRLHHGTAIATNTMTRAKTNILSAKILSGLLGFCVGDALGVPVEFCSRSQLEEAPVREMRGYGTHNRPTGTWSDESAVMFCVAEALSREDVTAEAFLNVTADRLVSWYEGEIWTLPDWDFEIGATTAKAIARLREGISPRLSGDMDEMSNGNGSLVRTLPFVFCHHLLPFPDLLDRIHLISGITHAHPRSQMACGFYISIAIALLQGCPPEEAYLQGIARVEPFYWHPPYSDRLFHFHNLIGGAIAELPREEIASGGYVIHTLEAALWCLLNASSYKETVLAAVNLGESTNAIAALAGGLAGLHYGVKDIPADWIQQIAEFYKILALCEQLTEKIFD
ncbi:MAG: ADP-ribosylglycohydrolase family protein [Cyanobacteria bacterium P01_E01_bin.42]